MKRRRSPSKNKRVTHLTEQLGDELAACTIITKNNLAHARVLANSFLKYHPKSRFFVLVIDEFDDYFDSSLEKFRTVRLQELDVDGIDGFAFRYNDLELRWAMKPFLIQHLFNKFDLKKLVFLDADILVTGKLLEVSRLLDEYNIVLTPHLTEPLADDRRPSEHDILLAGTYNGGFIAIARTTTTRSFLSWWSGHLRYECIMDPLRGLHGDQKWLELAAGMFGGVYVLRDAGHNAAYWNMGTRSLTKKRSQLFVNGKPLYFFHFSGFDAEKVDQISRHQNRFTLKHMPSYRILFQNYRDLLHANGYDTAKVWPYSYDYFDNGVRIPKVARTLYGASRELEKKYPDPFSTGKPRSYFNWLNSGVEFQGRRPLITKLWHEIYKMRIDVQKAYPDIFGVDRLAFVGWVCSAGRREHEIDEAFIPKEYLSVSPTRETAISHSLPEVNSRSAEELREENQILRQETSKKREFGVNLAGYFTGLFGNATSARAIAQTLKLAAIPHVLNKLVAEAHGEKYPNVTDFSDDCPYAINLIHLNADAAESFFQSKGPAYRRGRYNIGIWYWELPIFPSRWHSAFRFYDEVWATSSFVAETIAKLSPVPIVKMRHPLFVDESMIDPQARSKFNLPEDSYVFFFSFDFMSVFERKNPLGLLKAFRRVFGRNEKALLVLHHINSQFNPAAARLLKEESSNMNVKILEGHLSERDYLSLLAACDCYVSLHRSEGLGLTMAEAMYLGKPVIATAYSGNMDFMNINNSLLVKYDLVELNRNYGPYEKGSIWAEPNVEHAAELLRWVYENRHKAKSIGKRASKDIRQQLSPSVTANEIKARLLQIYEGLERERGYSRSFRILSRKDTADLSEAELNALDTLVSIYRERKDLKLEFPEAADGQYERLMNWAVNVITGNHPDGAYGRLSAHRDAIIMMDLRTRKDQVVRLRLLSQCRAAILCASAVLKRSVHVVRHEGARSFLRQVLEKLRQRKFSVVPIDPQ